MRIKLYIITSLIFFFISCSGQIKEKISGSSDTINKSITIAFMIDETRIDINNNFSLFFANGSDTLHAGIRGTKLVLPNLEKDTEYTVIFKYKYFNLSFNKILKRTILPDQNMEWLFGIENRPFNDSLGLLSYQDFKTDKKTRQLQYFQFRPQEYGDGIQFVKKIE